MTITDAAVANKLVPTCSWVTTGMTLLHFVNGSQYPRCYKSQDCIKHRCVVWTTHYCWIDSLLNKLHVTAPSLTNQCQACIQFGHHMEDVCNDRVVSMFW